MYLALHSKRNIYNKTTYAKGEVESNAFLSKVFKLSVMSVELSQAQLIRFKIFSLADN